MMLSHNENQRLKILYQYQILDTQPETVFDELTQLAADFCETPVALITLIDDRREWIKSTVGFTITEFPLNLAFGSYTIQENDIFIINDTYQDQRFVNHPLVISEPYFRFYAGVPLIDASGFALGCLSVMDFVPRKLNIKEQKALQGLAKQVMRCLDLHRQNILVNIQDVAEDERIEMILREDEARFNIIAQTIPVPLIISRISDGLILYANQECERTFYLSPENLVNHYTSELYFNYDEHQKLLTCFREYGAIHNYEIQLNRADGSHFWAIASLRYLKFHQESAILKVFYDITERKNSEAKLQEQNEFLQTIFESIPLMITIHDIDGKLQWVNPHLEQTLGWSLQDFQTRDIWAELYPHFQDREDAKKFFQDTQAIWGDFRTHSRDGRVVDTSWTNIKLPNGQCVGIGKNITDRKQTEQALKAQIAREKLMGTVAQRIRQSLNLQDILNATVQQVRDILKVDRVVVYQFAPDMSGKIVAESVGENWTVSLNVKIDDTCFQSGGGQDYYQGRKRAIANIYTAGLSECHLNLLARFEVKANLVVPIILEVGSQDSGSRLWGLLLAHQCSAPREWEEHQLDLLDHLTVQIAIAIQQSSIFQQAQTELEQRQKAEVELRSALAEKEVLLKEIHHRVKNNLQIVSSLLQLQAQTFQDPEIIKALRESQNRIESISLIHKNLYTSPNIGRLNVAEYINNLAASLLISYQIIPGRIGLETNIDTVSLDVDQAIACGLVINELISNALKHAFPDERSGKISITLRSDNQHIEMTVQDDGIGLPNDLDWRNTNSLGLSLVYDLVTEQLEGNITVEGHQGTKFNIDFPQLTWHK
ncbi:MAG TPA: GAF domain-containing protein [Nostocaceae cyanobacterium]|nr:GAF domain-containing protein [Nostocaceae cyanobacterium]